MQKWMEMDLPFLVSRGDPMFKPTRTVVFWDMHRGWFLAHNTHLYGPWKGRAEDGHRWDIYDVHEWGHDNLGVCSSPRQCYTIPERVLERREKEKTYQRSLW